MLTSKQNINTLHNFTTHLVDNALPEIYDKWARNTTKLSPNISSISMMCQKELFLFCCWNLFEAKMLFFGCISAVIFKSHSSLRKFFAHVGVTLNSINGITMMSSEICR